MTIQEVLIMAPVAITGEGLVDNFICTNIRTGLAPVKGIHFDFAVSTLIGEIQLLIDGLYNTPLVFYIDPSEYEAIYP